MKPNLPILERITEGVRRLTPREAFLLIAMVAIFGLMIGFVVLRGVGSGTSAIESEIDAYRRAIDALSERQEDISRQIERAEEIEVLLQGEELQLHGFLERLCDASTVDRPSSYTDNVTPVNDPRTGQATLNQVQTVAEINAVDPLPLSRLLNRIATAEELVFLRAIDLQPARGRADQYRVRLTLTTYRRIAGT